MTTAQKTLDLIDALRADGRAFCVATILRTADSTSARPGAKAVILPDGELFGFVGGGCVTGAVKRTALACLDTGEPRMIRVRPKDDVVTAVDVDGVHLHKSSCPSGGTVEIFLEPTRAPRTLAVFGASPIAQALLNSANGLGFHTIVIADEADREKVVGARRYLASIDDLEGALGARDSIVAATQGRRDLEALRAIAGSGAGYKAMVCSRKKRQALTERLAAEGAELVEGLAMLHAPAGLDIGAIEPEEIALSIMCELIAVHRRRPVPLDVPVTGAAT